MTGAPSGPLARRKQSHRALLLAAALLLPLLFGLNTCRHRGGTDVDFEFSPVRFMFPALMETLRDTSIYALALFILGLAALFLALLVRLRQRFGARSFRNGVMLAGIAIVANICALQQPPPPKPVQTELYFDDMDMFSTPSTPGATPVEPSAPATPVPTGATGV